MIVSNGYTGSISAIICVVQFDFKHGTSKGGGPLYQAIPTKP